MLSEALTRRLFPAIVLLLIALNAYFEASGLTQLASLSFLQTDPEALAGPWETRADAATTNAAVRRSVQAILERNPFDSATGPLVGGKAVPVPEASPEVKRAELLADPVNAPLCSGVVVHVVTESTDPTWSIAVLQAPGEPRGKLRRVGDDVSGKQVAYIGFNPYRSSPAVWLIDDSSLCQGLLFGGGQPTAPAAAPPPGAPAAAPAGADRGGVPPEIEKGIQKVSDTEFNVDRAVLDNILENQAQLMRSARIVPEQQGGKVVGIRLFGVRPNTLLGKLGVLNGDRLEAINGFEMASPEKALEAYARLRTSDHLTVKVTRRGAPVTLDFRIK